MVAKYHAPFLTNALLSSIRGNAQLPPNTWYFITGVTLSSINRPEGIPIVFRYVTDHGVGPTMISRPSQPEQLQIARRMREGLIKSAAVVGLPKTINGLLALKPATPDLLDEPLAHSPTGRLAEMNTMTSMQILDRGQKFFDDVYGKVSKRVMTQMERCGTEDLSLVARLMYGHLLSNLNVLTAAETSFVLLAGLIPQDVNPQVKGHLKGAINNGATVEEVRAVRELIIRICEASGMSRVTDAAPGLRGWREDVATI